MPGSSSREMWEQALLSEQWKINRIAELEKALIGIRDLILPSLKDNAHEADKVICGIGSIDYECAKVVPLFKFPRTK